MKTKLLTVLLTLPLLLSFTVTAETAQDITSTVSFETENISVAKITDDNLRTNSAGDAVRICGKADVPLGGVYIKYNCVPTSGVLNDSAAIAEYGFMHEYIPLDGENTFSLYYDSTDICDISVYSLGELPSDVQVWQNGSDQTDILLCATHSDDDQLFFAGLLPYYAGFRQLNVQVAYFINHYDTYNRTHELLDGLWHCGVTTYPEISNFPDGYSESAEKAEVFLRSKGFERDELLDFQRSLLAKYKPLVAVLHDFSGEYGHGAHMLNTGTFVEVCENPLSEQYIPEKIYVHLYGQSEIVLDIDTPLDCFDGKTAFNISQEAFGYHKSQHWTWFYDWIYGKEKASQIRSYNPTRYGLYYSAVGEDSANNDIMENVIPYSQRHSSAFAQIGFARIFDNTWGKPNVATPAVISVENSARRVNPTPAIAISTAVAGLCGFIFIKNKMKR